MKRLSLFVISLILIAITSCSKKSDNKPNVADLKTPTVTTIDASSITRTSALSGGVVTSDGGSTVTSRGVIWSTNSNPTISLTTKTRDSTVVGSNSYTSHLSGLASNTTYYVVAYATNSIGTAYGNQISFTTSVKSMPTISTIAVSGITGTTAKSGGNVTDDGGSPITAEGVIWSTSLNLTPSPTKTNDGTTVGAFTSNLSGLTPNTTYYVIAYATNSLGTAYGNQFSFKTSTSTSTSTPILTTTAISNVTATNATGGGNITSDGGSPITAKGVIWWVDHGAGYPTPTITYPLKTSDGTGVGSFASSLSALTPNTPYNVIAYATNSAGTSYGNQVSFTTSSASIQTLSTTAISNITSSTASSGGNITANGGIITDKGVIWSTSPNPTIALSTKTDDGNGGGSFTSNLSGLLPNTTYYVVAYATSNFGTAYGNQINFTTSTTIPTLSPTTVIGGVTSTTANIGGPLVISDGGSPITDAGVIWSTSPNPTTALSTKISVHVTVGVNSGYILLSGLTPKTTYYVVTYATNSVGTAYDNNLPVTFTTQ